MTRGMIRKIVRDNNGVPIKNIKYRLIRWQKFFEAKISHVAQSIDLDIADTFAEPYIYNWEVPTEEEIIISVVHKFKANKSPEEDPGEDGLRAEFFINVVHRPLQRTFNKYKKSSFYYC
ncbi:unnamed protein product [Dracunculus medinensis]|uniref:Uncharacterized protein n=1 Tax=Dracunculus medinensis TaxID=318479 RepID=A0A0N4UR54_DRAME|nr:unnamed protein product [Dracunculus medinensis]